MREVFQHLPARDADGVVESWEVKRREEGVGEALDELEDDQWELRGKDETRPGWAYKGL
jgi:hypothetical protein